MDPVFTGTSGESVGVLLRRALDETRDLARLEIALARREIEQEVQSGKRAGVGFGLATVLLIDGVALCFVALALAFGASWFPALMVGVALLCAGGIAALVGYEVAPRKPLGETRKRAETDLRMLREHTP